jgi:hypothetical protein
MAFITCPEILANTVSVPGRRVLSATRSKTSSIGTATCDTEYPPLLKCLPPELPQMAASSSLKRLILIHYV